MQGGAAHHCGQVCGGCGRLSWSIASSTGRHPESGSHPDPDAFSSKRELAGPRIKAALSDPATGVRWVWARKAASGSSTEFTALQWAPIPDGSDAAGQ